MHLLVALEKILAVMEEVIPMFVLLVFTCSLQSVASTNP